MNIKTNLFFLLIIQILILASTAFTQGNWELILPPYPSSNQLVSLNFADEHTGWAVGEYGTILKTTDGGENWSLIEIPWLDYLLDVHFPSALTGYAVGQNGIIFKTTNGGESWDKVSVKYSNNLNRVRFRDENNGWIIGEKGLILHTIDGGINWDQQLSNSRGNLKGVAIVDSSSLCVVGTDSTVLISNDNGKNWHPAAINSGIWSENTNLNDVFFLNDTLGWIGGNSFLNKGIILKTTDGGRSWNEEVKFEYYRYEEYSYSSYSDPSDAESFAFGIQQIQFNDLQYGLCLLDKSMYKSMMLNVPLYTQDGGKSWKCIMNGHKEYNNQDGRFCFLTENKVINTGFGGEFRFSYDRGLTWDYSNDSQRKIYKIFICNNGKILGRQRTLEGNIYIYSNDFGRNWQSFTPQIFDSTGKETDLKISSSFPGYFIDDVETLWIIHRSSSQILESNDFGLTWHSVRTGLSKNPGVSQPITPDTLIFYMLSRMEVSENTYRSELKFNYSFDGGRNVTSNQFQGVWNDIITSKVFISQIYDCHFLNGHTGFLVGSDGNIIKTIDTGQHWKNVNSGVVDDLFDIEFINQSVGFVVGKFGRILKTEDCGETWRKTNSGTQKDIYTVAFKNENEGWAGTENGLLYTMDCGENWYGVSLRYQHGMVRYIEFDKYGNGYAYSLSSSMKDYGVDEIIPESYNFMLCWKNDANLVEGSQDGEIYPKTLTLYPNYPNPFNSCTRIVYYLPETGSVNLKIFNIKGQLIRTLVDEYQGSGEHTVLWDGLSDYGQEVTSGVYVYRLGDGNEVRTRKMMLLR